MWPSSAARLRFTPPHVMSGQCTRNCSFTAGEVAGAVALAVSVMADPRQACDRGFRRWSRRSSLAAMILLSAVRGLPAHRGGAAFPVGRDLLDAFRRYRRARAARSPLPPPRILTLRRGSGPGVLLTTPATPPIRPPLEMRRPLGAVACGLGSEVRSGHDPGEGPDPLEFHRVVPAKGTHAVLAFCGRRRRASRSSAPGSVRVLTGCNKGDT